MTSVRTLAACLFAAALSSPLAAQFPGGGGRTSLSPTYSNLDYAGGGNSSQMLDLYIPTSGNGPFPVVVYIHGGAFRVGSKDSPPPYPDRLLPRGFAVASINYRLSSEAKWPAQIQDSKAAIRFLRANASKYNLDPDRIGVVGESAGAHLASMLGTSGETTIWDTATMANAGVSSRVQAVVDQFGPMDFGQMDAMQVPSCSAGTTSTSSSPESMLLGCTVGTSACAAAVTEASPVTYVSSKTPPFFIAHGSNDCNISHEQSRLLAQAITAAGGHPVFRVLPGAGHGTSEFSNSMYLAMLDNFLVRTLRAGSTPVLDSAEFQYAVAAPGQLVSIFGSDLAASETVAGTQPWPTALNGVVVTVKDSQAVSRDAGIVYTSPAQLNVQLPSALATGEAAISVTNGGRTVLQDKIEVISLAPTLFVQTVNRLSRPVGQMVWTDAAGVQHTAPLISVDSSGRTTAATLDFSQTPGAITLVLYGTGLNGSTGTVLARVADVAATVSFAGAQGTFAGLDQYNIVVPRTLAGRGDVMLSISIGGMPATAVRLTLK